MIRAGRVTSNHRRLRADELCEDAGPKYRADLTVLESSVSILPNSYLFDTEKNIRFRPYWKSRVCATLVVMYNSVVESNNVTCEFVTVELD